MMLKSALLVVLLAVAYAAEDKDKESNQKYTVTEEAWFEVEVKDLDGPGQVIVTFL